MFIPFARTHSEEKPQYQPPAFTALTPFVTSLFIGLGLGSLFTFLWPHFSGLVALAMWPLGLAIGMIMGCVTSIRRHGRPLWGMAILGQLLIVMAAGLLLIDYLAG